jgi:pimeloyl-ACP methyl ester carboxylesterase
MDAPPVEYVTTSDGYNIAYGVSGAGRPLVFVPFSLPHVQLSWQHPLLRPWLEGLAMRFRLVQYDLRGTGMSTRGLSSDQRMADLQLDLDAVLERLASPRPILFGVGVTAKIFLNYAVNHPERVDALIIAGMGIGLSNDTAPGIFRYGGCAGLDHFSVQHNAK